MKILENKIKKIIISKVKNDVKCGEFAVTSRDYDGVPAWLYQITRLSGGRVKLYGL